MESLAQRLSTGLQKIVSTMDEFLDCSTISDHRARNRKMAESGFIMMFADYGWAPLDDRQRQAQRRLLELWRPWVEQFRLLFSGDPSQTLEAISVAEKKASAWIQRNDERDFTVPTTIQAAKQVFREHLEPFFALLRSLAESSGAVFVVPDTNVLIRSSDVTKYGAVIDAERYTVLLMPGVLSELDKLKVERREELREKARAVSNRIKGWRNQGRLTEGVRVQGEVWVRAEGREPDFDHTLSWLQSDNMDDRIIASFLEAQRRNPRDRFVLLSGDTIMLAKADQANVPTADTPDPDV